MIGDWSFLKSRRFWALVAIAIVRVLEGEGIIPSTIANGIYTILAGFIGIRTIDKFSEAVAQSK
ncbi:MAG: hypothetical protein QW228_05700 [Candidatus Aenigmatarchaeota archaeon]